MNELNHVKELAAGEWRYVRELPTEPGNYRWYHNSSPTSGWHTWNPVIIDTVQEEQDWVFSELARTDKYMALSDYPHKETLTLYREELRAYTYDGNRPAAPTTPKGTPI